MLVKVWNREWGRGDPSKRPDRCYETENIHDSKPWPRVSVPVAMFLMRIKVHGSGCILTGAVGRGGMRMG